MGQISKTILYYFTLILLISFASINAVLFTPALPNIAQFFSISEELAQLSVSWFLIGYTFGLLLYGPLASRFGKKNALYIGIMIQILGSIGCILSSMIPSFMLLVASRLFVALGASVGLKMTFTLVNEGIDPKKASQIMSFLVLAFAITPGLGVALGGLLNTHWGWTSCFVAGVMQGALLLVLVIVLPIKEKRRDKTALSLARLKAAYLPQLRDLRLLAGGVLMGGASSFIYLFAAIAPFIGINEMGMSSSLYGVANIFPGLGMVLGSVLSVLLVRRFPIMDLVRLGIVLCFVGACIMALDAVSMPSPVWALFFPMTVTYIGISLVMANASTFALSTSSDKSHASAMLNFVNVGLATVSVLSISYFEVTIFLLPKVFLFLCVVVLPLGYWLLNNAPIAPESTFKL